MIFSFSDLLEVLFVGSVGRTKKINPKFQFFFFAQNQNFTGRSVEKKKNLVMRVATVTCVNYPFRSELSIRSRAGRGGGIQGSRGSESSPMNSCSNES